jgi:hypothetical protein
MSKKNEINIQLESAILLAVTSTQLEIQQEAPCVDRVEISRATLAALARMAAQEMIAVDRCDTVSVLQYLPKGAGLYFLSELQDELQRLNRHFE